jgi:hypothetical protein
VTREEFHARFRGRLLLYLTEAWAVRRSPPSELGSLMDAHVVQLKALLNEMYDVLVLPPAAPAVNGAAKAPAKG